MKGCVKVEQQQLQDVDVESVFKLECVGIDESAAAFLLPHPCVCYGYCAMKSDDDKTLQQNERDCKVAQTGELGQKNGNMATSFYDQANKKWP